jgi:SAM-dependent methyltransferase
MKDLFGKALLDYYDGNYSSDIITSTNISTEDILPLPYLFRDFEDMPKIERTALIMSKGTVLDIGCGAGSHSLYLQKQGLNVKAIDISEGAVEVSLKRGVRNAEILNVLNEKKKYDTLLLLMNGTGIFQTVKEAPTYLKHLKSLLAEKGQIFIDSSDLIYMYEDDDSGYWLDLNSDYYGELDYFISYKDEHEKPMQMLYLDINTLNRLCLEVDLKCELVVEGDHYDYLAKLTHP